MSRKDDPVFNVKFVQLVESHPCLWNYTLPAYSKKNEVQKAWQEVANETKDTLRNCRERWRIIRSSFLRSLKMARTSTGRGKRKYYLSKYLQFLIPYTKTRLKNGGALTTLRKCPPPPLARVNHMPLPIVSNEDTKESTTSEVAIVEEDVVVSIHEEVQLHHLPTIIKTEASANSSPESGRSQFNTSTTNTTSALSSIHNIHNMHNHNNSSNNNNTSTNGPLSEVPPQRSASEHPASSAVDLTEFAEWIKSKNDRQRHCLMSQPDADQSFLNSLHPFLREMSGKQNRRFRQKVIGLIDAILENAD